MLDCLRRGTRRARMVAFEAWSRDCQCHLDAFLIYKPPVRTMLLSLPPDSQKPLLLGFLLGSALTLTSTTILHSLFVLLQRRKPKNDAQEYNVPTGRGVGIVDGVDGLIGNTPMMRIRSLSEATGCTILVCGEL